MKRINLITILTVFSILIFVPILVNAETADDWVTKGFNYYKKGDNERALECYKKALTLDPNNYWANHNVGSRLFFFGRFDDAIPYLNKAIAIEPNTGYAYCTRGEVYLMMGKNKEALDDLEKFLVGLKQERHKKYIPYTEGCIYFATGEYSRAVEKFTTFLNTDPSYEYGFYFRGACFEKLGDYEKAKKDYKKACKIGLDDGCLAYEKVKNR